MPVPFDSNKPSFSIACLRKLRVGTFQANLPRHPYPFVLFRLAIGQARAGDEKTTKDCWQQHFTMSVILANGLQTYLYGFDWCLHSPSIPKTIYTSWSEPFIPPASFSRVPILETPLAPWSSLGQCAPLMQQMEARLDEKLATWLFKTSTGVKWRGWTTWRVYSTIDSHSKCGWSWLVKGWGMQNFRWNRNRCYLCWSWFVFVLLFGLCRLLGTTSSYLHRRYLDADRQADVHGTVVSLASKLLLVAANEPWNKQFDWKQSEELSCVCV